MATGEAGRDAWRLERGIWGQRVRDPEGERSRGSYAFPGGLLWLTGVCMPCRGRGAFAGYNLREVLQILGQEVKVEFVTGRSKLVPELSKQLEASVQLDLLEHALILLVHFAALLKLGLLILSDPSELNNLQVLNNKKQGSIIGKFHQQPQQRGVAGAFIHNQKLGHDLFLGSAMRD